MIEIQEVREISLEDLEIGTSQSRLRQVDKNVDDLADSIRKLGLLEPILVCAGEQEGKFEIVTGQRRFLACQRLGKESIRAAVMTERVDPTMAKAISLTENLVRRDLVRRDLVDACTELYRKYGTFKAVSEEFGLPAKDVSKYVKYAQLERHPGLKELVDQNVVNVQTAVRAKQAATSADLEVDEEAAVAYAREMAPKSTPQQKRLVEVAVARPEASRDEVIEESRKPPKVTGLRLQLLTPVHSQLQKFASDESTSAEDAAALLIEDGLDTRGYTIGGE